MNDVDFTASWTMVLTTYGSASHILSCHPSALWGDGNTDGLVLVPIHHPRMSGLMSRTSTVARGAFVYHESS